MKVDSVIMHASCLKTILINFSPLMEMCHHVRGKLRVSPLYLLTYCNTPGVTIHLTASMDLSTE
jgi:hypothetical protein